MSMSNLDADVRAANELGLSYGYYKALSYDPVTNSTMAAPTINPKRYGPMRYTDEQLFRLWQEGYTDEQIGAAAGVSRQYIQRWRDQLELPSTSKFPVDTKKYRLTTLRDGTYVVVNSDETLINSEL